MRAFLLGFMIFLVMVAAAIVGVAVAIDQKRLVLIAIAPALLFLPTLLVYLLVASRTAHKQRHQGMADLAERLALDYSAEVSHGVRTSLERFELIDATSKLFDQVQGERNGVPFTVLGCRVTGDGGQQMHHQYYTLCWIPDQLQGAPAFALTALSALPWRTRFPEGKEIRLAGAASADAFSKRYQLQAAPKADPQVVEAFFDEELIRSCLSEDGISFLVSHGCLFAWHSPTLKQDLLRGHHAMRENVSQHAEWTLNQTFAIHNALSQKLSR